MEGQSIRFTVIPNILGRFRVINWNTNVVSSQTVRLMKTDPIEINIPKSIDKAYRRIFIRDKLQKLVLDAYEQGKNNDINLFIDEDPDSPPIKLMPVSDEELKLILKGSTFRVVRINKLKMTRLGEERVFLRAPPSVKNDTCEYFKPDESKLLMVDKDHNGEPMKDAIPATCGFQALHQLYYGKKNMKKATKNFSGIKHYATKEPPMFQSWLKRYQSQINIDQLDKQIQYELEEDIVDFESEYFQLDTTTLSPDIFSDEEEHNSLSVLDLVRWCMNTRTNFYGVDYDGQVYLSYIHSEFVRGKTDNPDNDKAKYSVMVKIVNQHAYFVIDATVKASTCKRIQNWSSERFDNPNISTAKIHNSFNDDIPTREADESDESYNDRCDKFKKDFRESSWLAPTLTHQELKDKPPPTPEQILSGEKKTYYLGVSNLNGLVSWMLKHTDTIPDRLFGNTSHTIDSFMIGDTTIKSNKHYPYTKEPPLRVIDTLKQLYPELPVKTFPTATQVGKQIFKSSVKDDKELQSYTNSNTDRIFYDGELKGDNRVRAKRLRTPFAHSLDLCKAYTNSIIDMDVSYSVYDAVSQPQRYDGYFNPNYFYLCRELKNVYPLRGVKGLVLYHGCLLRHLLGKGLIIINYVIKPIKELPADYLKKFAQDTISLCEKEKLGTDLSYKRIINSWVGSLKKGEKVAGYTHHATTSCDTATRAFYSGSLLSNLDEERFLLSKPIIRRYMMTAQPIRLQIMEKCNEKLLDIYHTYRVGLTLQKYLCSKDSNYNTKASLAMCRTDAIYFESPIKKSKKPIVSEKRVSESDGGAYQYWEPAQLYVDKELYKRYEKLLDFVENNCKTECKREKEIVSPLWTFTKFRSQRRVMLQGNRWRDTLEIDKAWTKEKGAGLLLTYAITKGGVWFEGRAGVGKTEILKCLDKKLDINRQKYRWMKPYYKAKYNHTYYSECEDWREDNPCFAIKLAPTNKACNLIGGKTLNRGLGIPVITIDEEKVEKDEGGYSENYFEKVITVIAGDGFQKPCYDLIVIDEISMISGQMWSFLYYIKKRIPRVKFILCGDIKRQLPPVGEEYRNFMGAYVIKELANFTKIKLEYSFRNSMVGDVLWDEWSKNPEQFKIEPEAPMTEINLSWTNKTRKSVIRDKQFALTGDIHTIIATDYVKEDNSYITDPDKQLSWIVFKIGSPFIANKSNTETGVAKNEIWKVSNIQDDEITLRLTSDREITITREELFYGWYSGYCITIHKSQGETFADKYTIWDWDRIPKNSLGRRLRYVAQSRSKDPENNITYK